MEQQAALTPLELNRLIREKSEKREKIFRIVLKIIIYIGLILLFFISILPFYIVLVNATRSTKELQLDFYLTFGSNLSQNIEWLKKQKVPFVSAFLNSVYISAGSIVLSVYISSLTAYALVVYDFKLRNPIFILVLLLIMVPSQLSVVGFYALIRSLGLYDNIWAFILPSAVAPTTVFFMRQYIIANIPMDYIESARIDGCREFWIFNIIVLPLLVPALATMAIFSLIASWNNFFMPKIILNHKEKWTLPVLMDKLKGDIYRREIGPLYTALAIAIMPLLVFYGLLSKFIIKGVALGGLKE
ncbi:MAG TPA: carbohydrate ABC transporter permease [Clostridia bacterium]